MIASERGEADGCDNPFSARSIRPGALPFLFPAGQSAAQLIDRLRLDHWWGEIVGPHGSGKSALVAALIPAMEAAGGHVVLVELHNGQRRLPHDFYRAIHKRGQNYFPEVSSPKRHATERKENSSDPFCVVVVDGYEQLSFLSRFWLRRCCRRRRLGLLVTAHGSVGLPELFRSAATLARAERIVSELLRGRPQHVSMQEVAERFSRYGGNLREMLFDLYDLYEQRRSMSNL